MLQGRNELPALIELVEHVRTRCRVYAPIGESASFLELGIKVSQIRYRCAQVRLMGHNTLS
jgi:hypothetical protein